MDYKFDVLYVLYVGLAKFKKIIAVKQISRKQDIITAAGYDFEVLKIKQNLDTSDFTVYAGLDTSGVKNNERNWHSDYCSKVINSLIKNFWKRVTD